MALTGKQRRHLRALGHSLRAIVQVGREGASNEVVAACDNALADHELIKVKIGRECPEDRHDVAERLDAEPGISIVQMVGRVLLLYKRHPQKPRYEGKRAKAAQEAAKEGAKGSRPGRRQARRGRG